jgi:hypothetical protein
MSENVPSVVIDGFAKQSHLIWHLTAVGAETQIGGPLPLDTVIAAYVARKNGQVSLALMPE